jgi:hypothetical protein
VRLEGLDQLKNAMTSSEIVSTLLRPVTGIALPVHLHGHEENLRNVSTAAVTFSENLTDLLT